MTVSIKTGSFAESQEHVLFAGSPLPFPLESAQPVFANPRKSSGLKRNQSAPDRKKWGVLLAEASDFLEEALSEEEYRRQASLDNALAKFTEAANLTGDLNKQSRSFFNVFWTYMGSPDLMTNDNACKAMVRILRDFAGNPTASEKDVEKYLSNIADTGLEFTWISS